MEIVSVLKLNINPRNILRKYGLPWIGSQERPHQERPQQG